MNNEIKKKNDLILKSRCEELLKIKKEETNTEWKRVYRDLYTTPYSVKLDSGEKYPVVADLFRISVHKNIHYILAFSDLSQQLHNKSYKPLRELVNLVFANEK